MKRFQGSSVPGFQGWVLGVLRVLGVLAVLGVLGVLGVATSASAQTMDSNAVLASIDRRAAAYRDVAMKIWSMAEVGYQETQSSALLQEQLRAAGFNIAAGVAEMPTAFTATWGSGKPVIGIIGEFDALPGLSQAADPIRRAVVENGAGHGCGHHLFGTASTAAAIAVKEWLAANKRGGTIRFYGTPAEEGGGGKVYMLRAGLFDDVDAVVTMHPGDRNAASASSNLANISGKFRFRGVSAHAAGAPHRGRSALDGVEAMNHMVNMMREHVPQETRIHYVITQGGSAPNVIPDFAEVFYYVRHPDPRQVHEIFERVSKSAEGAALGTGTRVEHEIIHGIYAVLPNEPLARAMDANLRRVGGVQYDAKERAFAETLRKSLGDDAPPVDSAAEVAPFAFYRSGGSTDVADVSWVMPTLQLSVTTAPADAPWHAWPVVACGGMSIGHKGMIHASKALAATMVDLFRDPKQVAVIAKEFEEKTRGIEYVPYIPAGPPVPPPTN